MRLILVLDLESTDEHTDGQKCEGGRHDSKDDARTKEGTSTYGHHIFEYRR